MLLGHPSAERFAAGVYALAAGRTTELSRALLRHAACGRVSGEYAAVLHALVGERPLAPAVAGLLATGSTSGRAMALGLCTAIDLVERTTAGPLTRHEPAPAGGQGPSCVEASVRDGALDRRQHRPSASHWEMRQPSVRESSGVDVRGRASGR